MGAFIVGTNMPGYLPTGDPYAVETFGEARETLLEELRQTENDAWMGDSENAKRVARECRSARGNVRKMRAKHFPKDRFSGDTVYADGIAYWIHYDPDVNAEEYNGNGEYLGG